MPSSIEGGQNPPQTGETSPLVNHAVRQCIFHKLKLDLTVVGEFQPPSVHLYADLEVTELPS
jgi:hypothetical protein